MQIARFVPSEVNRKIGMPLRWEVCVYIGIDQDRFKGIVSKVARLWQVIVLQASIFQEQIVRRSALIADLHPTGLEPATL
jgi:hypothetical protein